MAMERSGSTIGTGGSGGVGTRRVGGGGESVGAVGTTRRSQTTKILT